MKKNIVSIALLFCLFYFLFLFACSKSSGSKHSPSDSKFRFTYNGIKYELPYHEGIAVWGVNNGIYINRPDLFGGAIYFPTSNCAYLDPEYDIIDDGNCHLTKNGAPIDSAVVYLYESGSFSTDYSNCSQKSEVDIITGTTINYSVCDATGTFNLTLKNSEGNTIVITDGSFEVYSMRR